MPKTYYTCRETKGDVAGKRHLRAIRRTEAGAKAHNWRLSTCGTCGEDTFWLDNDWHHENPWLDKEHLATPDRVDNG